MTWMLSKLHPPSSFMCCRNTGQPDGYATDSARLERQPPRMTAAAASFPLSALSSDGWEPSARSSSHSSQPHGTARPANSSSTVSSAPTLPLASALGLTAHLSDSSSPSLATNLTSTKHRKSPHPTDTGSTLSSSLLASSSGLLRDSGILGSLPSDPSLAAHLRALGLTADTLTLSTGRQRPEEAQGAEFSYGMSDSDSLSSESGSFAQVARKAPSSSSTSSVMEDDSEQRWLQTLTDLKRGGRAPSL